MKKIFFAALVLMTLTACKNVKETAEIIDLPRTETPDSVAATDSMDIHSVMIVRDGSVIYSRWQSEGVDTVPHVLHSVSKTFTATAVGLAIADGKLALTDKVIEFFPDKLPAEVSDSLKAMTVRDLLTMTCGHDVEPNGQRGEGIDWVEGGLPGLARRTQAWHILPLQQPRHLYALSHRSEGDWPEGGRLSRRPALPAPPHRQTALGGESAGHQLRWLGTLPEDRGLGEDGPVAAPEW